MVGRLRTGAVTLALTLAACGRGGPRSAPLGAPPPAIAVADDGSRIANVSFADVGLEAASLDPNVAPCVDFFQYACGGWLAANPIPADKARHGRFSELEDRTDHAVRAVLDDLIAQPATGDDVAQPLADFYGSCLDEAAIDQRGVAGLAPLLGPIAKVKDVASLQTALIALHRHGIPAVWSLRIYSDLHDPTTNIIYLATAGLGLPERELYLGDDFAAARTAYAAHLVRLFGLLGEGKDSARLAAAVMTLETRLAHLTITAGARRDASVLYNPTDLDGLAAAVPAIDWPAYFTALGNPAPGTIAVTAPAFVAELSALITVPAEPSSSSGAPVATSATAASIAASRSRPR